jgi:hypothetical protein
VSAEPQSPKANRPYPWTIVGKMRRELRWWLRQLAFTVMSVGVLFGFTWLSMWAEAAYKADHNVSNWFVPTTAANAMQDSPRTEEKVNRVDARATVSEKEAAHEALPNRSRNESPTKAEMNMGPKAPGKAAPLQDSGRVGTDPLEALIKPAFRVNGGQHAR